MDQVTVDSIGAQPLADQLHGFRIDSPRPDEASSAPSLTIRGWLLGRAAKAVAVEVLQDGELVLRMPTSGLRPDLADVFKGVPGVEECGFEGCLGSLRLAPRFELQVRGTLSNGVRIALATIAGRRRPVEGLDAVTPAPLIVTTLGRTGSTWCLWTLQSHPEIIAHSPFANDARVGSYWMSVLQTLADPASYMRQLYPGKIKGPDWWIGAEANTPMRLRDADLTAWLGGERLRAIAEMCREQIGSFYEFEARAQDKSPKYFVEKYLPRQVTTELLRELYPGAAEVMLVRDLRDMYCSILAFNRKRGYSAFGRAGAASDAEYVGTVRRSAEALLRDLRTEGRNTHLLRYEELIQRPIETLEPLLEAIGLDPAGAGEMVERASISVEGMDHHMTAGDAAASIGRWRTDLEPELVDLCEQELTPMLAEFGYKTTSGSSAA